MTDVTILYRPVGALELELILDSGGRAFPPRLAGQPIFYPVLNLGYATQIARDWNTKDERSSFAGFVTEFDVDADYATGFPVHVVGSREQAELWVPADQLDEFNRHIRGRIRVVAAYYGEKYSGSVHERVQLAERSQP